MNKKKYRKSPDSQISRKLTSRFTKTLGCLGLPVEEDTIVHQQIVTPAGGGFHMTQTMLSNGMRITVQHNKSITIFQKKNGDVYMN